MSFADETITLANGVLSEAVVVETANPASFHQALSEPDGVPPAVIHGKLFLPSSAEGPVPLVIVVPGSLGVAPSHLYKAELLTDAGIAACVIDPFGERGVTSTVANQAQYSFAASAWDVLASVRHFVDDARIHGERIGAQGHSRGGSAVLSAATMAELSGGPALAAVYAAYPWSGQQFERPVLGRTVVRAIIGDRDEWCLPQQVQGHIHAMRLIGGNASCRIVEAAHHSFDRDTPIEMVEDASVSPGAPTAYIRDDGAFYHPLSEEADPALSERDLMVYGVKSGHGRRGARIGSEPGQADVFHKDMMTFWRTVLQAG
jgi:dienelactone hydrolase